jgi:medium-chain acyl-[acyl-carrier-protein] hydrolase
MSAIQVLEKPAAERDSASRYLHRFSKKQAQRPRIRVFLFPYAGGSASVFRDWPAYFDDRYELIAIQLPGRGSRLGEPVVEDFSLLVQHIADAIAAGADGTQFVFFGHSMGALLAHAVAEEFARRRHPQPECMFLSGRKAPHSPGKRHPVENMTDEDFMEELRSLGGTPEEVLADPDMMKLMLPTARADFALLDHWYLQAPSAPPVPSIAMPIYAMAARRDMHCLPVDSEEWRHYTHGVFELLEYNGGHFFIHKVQSRVIADVRHRLDNLLFG